MDAAAVTVRGVPLFDAYLAGTSEERVPVLFEIDTVPVASVTRHFPFELCVLLDKSGSMGGEKIHAAKEAVHKIIDSLVDGDVLHLVTYDNDAQTVLENATQQGAAAAHELVSNINASGATNISAGLERAQELLANTGGGERSKRVFLLSDGCATRGLCGADELKREAASMREAGMLISTFGIGQDFDETVMKGMAESGRGSYFYLRESIIRQTITDAMNSLQTTVGVGATIRVQSLPPAGYLTRIFSQLEDEDEPATEEVYQSAEPMEGVAGTVWVGDLQVRGHKQQLIEARLNIPGGALEGQEVTMLQYELRFHCPSSGTEMRIPGFVTIRIGESGVRASQVQVADVLQQVQPRQEEFALLMEDGQREEALLLQRQVIQELEDIQELDTQGYATSQIRRLQRVAERLENNRITSTQARLMVGEALQRSNSGDLGRLTSPPGTPPAARRLPRFDSPSSPVALQRSNSGDLGRLTSTPGTPPVARRLPRFDSPPSPVVPSKPEHLLADDCDRASLPSELFCPITHDVMTDPVVAQDGHTYERKAIEHWFADGNLSSPKTGQQLPTTNLIPNHAIRAQIMTENEGKGKGKGMARAWTRARAVMGSMHDVTCFPRLPVTGDRRTSTDSDKCAVQ